ncbi:alpha/beta hydrolase [Pseudonocardia ailaonensis]|uniref:Alpha/beta hydrolase n=1 Tax=Pseudonocardia ailaonensis TaxID=367279 RepID=A0ABN2MV67_9PSEU
MSTGPSGTTARTPAVPAVDAELGAALDLARPGLPATITADLIPALQQASAMTPEALAELAAASGFEFEVRSVDGMFDVVVGRPGAVARPAPVVYFVHGGGMVMGSPAFGLDLALPWAEEAGAVVVSVGYRLAPGQPDPVPAEDCWAGLAWTVAHADELSVDPGRIVVAGHSAGAGLAAGVALRARDEGGPALLGQLLMCPMLDDRERTPSSTALDGQGVWDRTSNRVGWTALLGDRRAGPDVSPYTAPARAGDVAGLAPAYLDVGSVETFRDEVVEYAGRIWLDGGDAELHVWPGAYHCFEIVAPTAVVSRRALAARAQWMARILGTMPRPAGRRGQRPIA